MASGSICAGGQESASSGAGGDALDTLTNPNLALLPAVDLVIHLHRDGRSESDFADIALVLAVRERRLAETEARIREADVDAAGLRDRIRALELRLAKARALARHPMVAGEDDESQAGDHLTTSDIGAAEVTGGEIRARNLEIVAVAEPGAGENTPGVCFEAGAEDDIPSPVPLMMIRPFPVPVTAAPALPDELIEERTVERHEVAEAGVEDCGDKVSEVIARKRRKKPASYLPLPLDDIRGHEVMEAGVVDCQDKAITHKRKKPMSDLPQTLEDHRVTGYKVSEEEAHGEDVAEEEAHGEDVAEEEAHGEDVAASPARATKKARKQKTSFYNELRKALMAKQNLLMKKKEASTKKAAAAASKQLHCTCWWSDAPYSP